MKIYTRSIIRIVFLVLFSFSVVQSQEVNLAQEINLEEMVSSPDLNLKLDSLVRGFMQGILTIPRGVTKLQICALSKFENILDTTHSTVEKLFSGHIKNNTTLVNRLFGYETGYIMGDVFVLGIIIHLLRQTDYYKNVKTDAARTLFTLLVVMAMVPALIVAEYSEILSAETAEKS